MKKEKILLFMTWHVLCLTYTVSIPWEGVTPQHFQARVNLSHMIQEYVWTECTYYYQRTGCVYNWNHTYCRQVAQLKITPVLYTYLRKSMKLLVNDLHCPSPGIRVMWMRSTLRQSLLWDLKQCGMCNPPAIFLVSVMCEIYTDTFWGEFH